MHSDIYLQFVKARTIGRAYCDWSLLTPCPGLRMRVASLDLRELDCPTGIGFELQGLQACFPGSSQASQKVKDDAWAGSQRAEPLVGPKVLM